MFYTWNHLSFRPVFDPPFSIVFNWPFPGSINIFQRIVIIMITFTVISHVLKEQQMIFECHITVATIACAWVSSNVNDGTLNLQSKKQQAKSQKSAMIVNIWYICKWNKTLLIKLRFLILFHRKRQIADWIIWWFCTYVKFMTLFEIAIWLRVHLYYYYISI